MNSYLKYGLVALGIAIIGFAIYFLAIKPSQHSEIDHQTEDYTCSMHPEIIRDKPGSCPICGMTLVKKVVRNEVVENKSIDNLLKPTDNFIIGNYKTTIPKDTTLTTEINLPGIVAYDPNAAVNIAARMNGRIERMYVNYKFQRVSKGQKLFDLYSPELLTEQQNFLYLVSDEIGNHESIINASKDKLLLYGMTNSQIKDLVSTRKSNPIISIYSPASGNIEGTDSMTKVTGAIMQNSSGSTEPLSIKEGDYIKKSQTVFKLLNTDKVWGVFNVSQGFNRFIKTNQSIRISTELDETNFISARINFIETQFNPADKTNRIRVYLNNSTSKLPIGLRLQGVVKTNPIKGIWIPKEAMVSIGTKKIVFVKMGNGFKATSIKIGTEIADFIQIMDGISVQDSIAENGNYLIDSESFIKNQ
ncbi:efflux RND transporter periplasmic adaptor subunit [Flavobacterium soyangense]|uniref:Efflux RND transporter periplasmic adaptor subunit n=1 Tax=Flavobacterium soyangense TaxID=2023265 RepID=A0A930UCV1_9FLAO|nr:efflux RND transporter periplasmic adaptor subunit [Flavobacterium soyangense]MBF2709059.1 efflux RND transporter periplasmic adaptor subunit [Flavobacterium soyangense]